LPGWSSGAVVIGSLPPSVHLSALRLAPPSCDRADGVKCLSVHLVREGRPAGQRAPDQAKAAAKSVANWPNERAGRPSRTGMSPDNQAASPSAIRLKAWAFISATGSGSP